MNTPKAENYFSQFKRSLNGTHHHVSRKHLGRYFDECDFWYPTCAMTDSHDSTGSWARRLDGGSVTGE